MTIQTPVHIDEATLLNRLQEANDAVTVGCLYTHYRDSKLVYKVLSIALLEATEKPCIIYQMQYAPYMIWVRALDDWQAKVNVGGQMVPRFQKKQ